MVSSRNYTTDGPSFTPLPYGLLDAVEVVTQEGGDPHWQNGLDFQPDVCFSADSVAVACVTGGVTKPPTADELPTRGSNAFAVFSHIPCAPVGWGNQLEDLEKQVIGGLERSEHVAVERTLWTGTALGGTINPHLAENTEIIEDGVVLQSAATVVTGSVVDVVEGISLLEDAMTDCYAGTPTIHVPRRAVAQLAAYMQLVPDGDRYRTVSGSIVVAGSGYGLEGPTGVAPTDGTGWFYATGAVKVWRSGISAYTGAADSLDRSKNFTHMVAERTYVIGWDCCHFAQQVRFGGVDAGAVGQST